MSYAQNGKELLELLITIAGKRKTKFILWLVIICGLIIGGLWFTNAAIDYTQNITSKLTLLSVNWPLVWQFLFPISILVLAIVVFPVVSAFVFAVIIRLSITPSEKHPFMVIIQDFIKLLQETEKRLPIEDLPQIESLRKRAEELRTRHFLLHFVIIGLFAVWCYFLWKKGMKVFAHLFRRNR